MVKQTHSHCPFCKCYLIEEDVPVKALCLASQSHDNPVITYADKPVFGADVTLSPAIMLPGATECKLQTELGWLKIGTKENLYITDSSDVAQVFDTGTLAIRNNTPIVFVNCLQDKAANTLFCFHQKNSVD